MLRKLRWIIPMLLAACVMTGTVRGGEEQPLSEAGIKVQLNGRRLDTVVIRLFDGDVSNKHTRLTVVQGILLMLEHRSSYRFRTADPFDGRLFLAERDGSLKLVGIKTGYRFDNGKKVAYNPLDELAPQEVANLWGTTIDLWNESVAAKIKHIDGARTCLTLSDLTAQGEAHALPPLPPQTQILTLFEKAGVQFNDLSGLATLNDLRLFGFTTYRKAPLDLATVAQNTHLLYMDIGGATLVHPEKLAALSELRYLNISYCKGVENIDFLKNMPKLRELEISGTAVKDLSPLKGHHGLQALRANKTQTAAMPETVEANLKVIEALDTALSEKTAAAFEDANPHCRLLFNLDKAFAQALKGIDAVRVRMGMNLPMMQEESIVFTETDAAKLKELLEHLKVDPKSPGLQCPCSTGPFVEFMKGDDLKAIVAYRHGQSVEWLGGLVGNWNITPASLKFLSAWLTERGTLVPKDDGSTPQDGGEAPVPVPVPVPDSILNP